MMFDKFEYVCACDLMEDQCGKPNPMTELSEQYVITDEIKLSHGAAQNLCLLLAVGKSFVGQQGARGWRDV